MHLYNRFRFIVFWCLLAGTFAVTSAAVSTTLINSTNAAIDTIRKRNCAITVTAENTSALSGLTVSVKQIRHHFGFGAAIPYSILSDTNLQKVFLSHYEWAVFENDLKWTETDQTADGPNYSRADSMLAFCQRNNVKVRGHNLFWNQDTTKIPSWARHLSTTAFQSEVDKRTEKTLTHYKGQISQWDIANEVIHGNQLETKTGNKNIWNYVFAKARATDSTLQITMNDFNIIEQYSDVDSFVRKVNTIRNLATGSKGPIDIIGLEGHFGKYMVQSEYQTKLAKVVALGLPIWLTEVDFTVPIADRADKLEELMRTAFATPKMEGFMMWAFWGGNRWVKDLTCYIADSATYSINDLGTRYESLMKLWTTSASGTTDASGKYTFKGIHGTYVVTTTVAGKNQIDTVYLEPGTGTKAISIVYRPPSVVYNRPAIHSGQTVRINGIPISINADLEAKEPVMLSIYTTSGKLITKKQFDRTMKGISLKLPAGCCIYSIECGNKVVGRMRVVNTGL